MMNVVKKIPAKIPAGRLLAGLVLLAFSLTALPACNSRKAESARHSDKTSSNNAGKTTQIMMTWKDVLNYASNGNPVPDKRVEKTKAEWQQLLTKEQYYVTREHGTESPFSNELCYKHDPGLYACICCGSLLFDANVKFDSGTGWPSFTTPYQENSVKYIKDNSFGMVRIETQCNVCDAHLGHVFPDGPAPSGLRYCINGVALKKVD